MTLQKIILDAVQQAAESSLDESQKEQHIEDVEKIRKIVRDNGKCGLFALCLVYAEQLNVEEAKDW